MRQTKAQVQKEAERREALERKAREPIPDIEALLNELSARLDACSGDGLIEWRIDRVRDSMMRFREHIVIQMEGIQCDCEKLQADINARVETDEVPKAISFGKE